MNGWIILALALSLCARAELSFAEGDPIVRIGQSGEFLELEHRINGQSFKSYLPLHQAAGVRYFSAGVGLEERAAVYPPFSLKLVLTAGGKPFLAGVGVAIQPAKGETAIRIPPEQVEGPWLFVDLPPGTYDITATHAKREQKLTGVKVAGGKQKVMYLRWPDDRAVAGRVPTE